MIAGKPQSAADEIITGGFVSALARKVISAIVRLLQVSPIDKVCL